VAAVSHRNNRSVNRNADTMSRCTAAWWYKGNWASDAAIMHDGDKLLALDTSIGLGIAAAGAAVLGSMLGLGGGVFLVPIFTLFFGVDARVAIAASAVAVVTNSVAGSSVHLRSGFTNIRLAMLLQVTTAIGAIAGAYVAIAAELDLIYGVFGVVLIASGISMLVRRQAAVPNAPPDAPDPMQLRSEYVDPATSRLIAYVPRRLPAGITVSGAAGVISGMLGIGGGAVQVPAMNLLMHVPVKAAAGTSTFMVGMTAVASALVFYADDLIDPRVVVPAMVGVFFGARIGSQLTRRVRTQNLVVVFVLILLYLGFSLVLRAFGITLPGQQE
jgi:uncharacterized protein